MDSGAEEHVGDTSLKAAQIRLRRATGDDMGVFGRFVVRGWFENKLVELTALVATRAARSLCSATKLASAGYSIEMIPIHSLLHHKGGGNILQA